MQRMFPRTNGSRCAKPLFFFIRLVVSLVLVVTLWFLGTSFTGNFTEAASRSFWMVSRGIGSW
jgi:hypothetical protein